MEWTSLHAACQGRPLSVMASTPSWTPFKAQAFDVVSGGTSPETIVDATTFVVGLSEVHCVQHTGGLNFQVTVKCIASMALIVDTDDR
ncbi:hypothetical protein HPB50_005358 [Hyalomma asiaticum]|uniref:Uncharacterized protein n=1 Tax=Hyalomma asiaticum TaxID=266040 RepID=A0ACB7SCT3_HYAAI|nr:hypothetical protein HPB50_005358 [Hyalomma asiaticum]